MNKNKPYNSLQKMIDLSIDKRWYVVKSTNQPIILLIGKKS